MLIDAGATTNIKDKFNRMSIDFFKGKYFMKSLMFDKNENNILYFIIITKE